MYDYHNPPCQRQSQKLYIVFSKSDRLLEGEEPLTTQTDRMRESYLAALGKYLEELDSRCMGSHIDYTMANTTRPLDAVLSEVVRKRQNLNGPSGAARL